MNNGSHMRCRYCRQELKSSQGFCPNCGAPLDAGAVEYIEPEKPKAAPKPKPKPRPEPKQEKKPHYEPPRPRAPEMPQNKTWVPETTLTPLRNMPGYNWRVPRLELNFWPFKRRTGRRRSFKLLKTILIIALICVGLSRVDAQTWEKVFVWVSKTSQSVAQIGAYDRLMEGLPFAYLPPDFGTESQESYGRKVSDREYEFLEFGYANNFLTVYEKTQVFLCPEAEEEALMEKLAEDPEIWDQDAKVQRMGNYLSITHRISGLENSEALLKTLSQQVMPLHREGENIFLRSKEIKNQLQQQGYCRK